MLISKEVDLRWSGPIVNYYKSKGYRFTERGGKFTVKVEHLPPHSNAKVEVKCDYCGDIFITKYVSYNRSQERLPKDSCRNCSRDKSNEIKIINSGSLFRKYPELAKEWHPSNDKTSKQINYGSSRKVKWICKEGHTWEAAVRDRIKGVGCPICSESKGEKKVSEVLETLEVEFRREVMFDDLIGIGGGYLRYDFGIYAKGRLQGLIEYDGVYHFKKLYEGDNHETVKKHDEIKNKYCKERDIPLLRIPYTKKDKTKKLVTRFIIDIFGQEEANDNDAD